MRPQGAITTLASQTRARGVCRFAWASRPGPAADNPGRGRILFSDVGASRTRSLPLRFLLRGTRQRHRGASLIASLVNKGLAALTREQVRAGAAAKGKLVGTVEAVDERAAIEKAAEEFKQDLAKLIAVQRR